MRCQGVFHEDKDRVAPRSRSGQEAMRLVMLRGPGARDPQWEHSRRQLEPGKGGKWGYGRPRAGELAGKWFGGRPGGTCLPSCGQAPCHLSAWLPVMRQSQDLLRFPVAWLAGGLACFGEAWVRLFDFLIGSSELHEVGMCHGAAGS